VLLSGRLNGIDRLEDMEGFKDFALEVDLVVDFIIPIADETLDRCGACNRIQHAFRAMAGFGVGSLRMAETRAPV